MEIYGLRLVVLATLFTTKLEGSHGICFCLSHIEKPFFAAKGHVVGGNQVLRSGKGDIPSSRVDWNHEAPMISPSICSGRSLICTDFYAIEPASL